MKSWFPFTDYDFYAYLTAGLTVMFALDFALNSGAIMLRETWPFVQIVFALAMAYLLGQIIAGIAAVILEHWLARRVLQSPMTVLLALKPLRRRESIVGRWVVGRYYEPLPEANRKIAFSTAATALGTLPEAIKDAEDVFQIALPVARSVADTATRLDDFRKVYGFSRNMSLAALIAAVAVAYRAAATGETSLYLWAALIVLAAFALFARFLKFYAAYAAEVLRTYVSKSISSKTEAKP